MVEPAGSGELLDDSMLVARATRGDQHAFGELFDRHIQPVYWQAYQVVGDPDEAQDIAQETFVTAWRRLGEITIVDRSALPWLLVTARFTALNASRKRGRLRSVHLENELADNHETPSEQVEAATVREAIAADSRAACRRRTTRRTGQSCRTCAALRETLARSSPHC